MAPANLSGNLFRVHFVKPDGEARDALLSNRRALDAVRALEGAGKGKGTRR